MTVAKPIIVLGIFNADAVYRASRQPKIGETIMGQDFRLEPGGKGSNQAVAAAKAAGPGNAVHIITRLGRDDFAKMARSVWQDAGVIPEVKEDPESHTGSAFIFIEAATGNNAIIVAAGAGARISPDDLQARADLIRGAGVFITQLEQPLEAARTGLRLARQAGVTTILNPAPAAELDDDLLALCDFITPNESEAELLTDIPVTDIDSAARAADALLSRGVGAVVVTLGANGVLYRDRRTQLHIPVISAGPVVETTGAGDAFNGGFAVALSEGMEIGAALRFGNATAGLSVTRAGAAAAMADRAQIDAVLR
ncbi:ribokinase [Xinfangfangia sp. D13-10-4-6]|uniref:ribokinase n=1 Tax=Pseudogemmobacter hezensis TaxID=2737662 RepID=UPI001551BC49|nr:ribokinase [Pseudogemmobacter hezensis]NPD16193.1 ribokinase [Pseudogemmobacter hezensis]